MMTKTKGGVQTSRFVSLMLAVLSLAGAALAQSDSSAQSDSQPPQSLLPTCIVDAVWSSAAIDQNKLTRAKVAVKSDLGQFAMLHVVADDTIKIERIYVYDKDGRRANGRSNIYIRSGYILDVDTIKITSRGADVQWHAQKLGQKQLRPLNGAQLYLCPETQSLFSRDRPSLFGGLIRDEGAGATSDKPLSRDSAE